MSVTTTRDATKLELLQQQPEATVNDALDNIDKRDQILSLSGQTGGTVTLTKAQALCGIWHVTGTLTSDLVVKFPATGYTRSPVVYNGTTGAFTVTISPNSGGTGVAVGQGRRKSVYFDGTNVVDATADFSGARVYNSANLSIPNATFTALTFNSERFDTDSYHSASSNTSRLTAPVTGYYDITCAVAFAVNAAGIRQAFLKLNGTTFIAGYSNLAPNGTNEIYFTLNALYYLTAGDYVEVHVYQSSGGALNVNGAGNYSPEFSIHLLK